jgi:probable rRNA maturation factor
MMDLLVRPEVKRLIDKAARQALAARVRLALRALDRSHSEVTLLLTSDEEIRALNKTYRKLDRATDVLSFHQLELQDESDPRAVGAFLGDVVISVETATRRAGRARLAGELARLAIHGLCHLFGHDHHRPGEARAMRALERKLLRLSRPKVSTGGVKA